MSEYILIGLSALSAFLLLIVIILLLSKKSGNINAELKEAAKSQSEALEVISERLERRLVEAENRQEASRRETQASLEAVRGTLERSLERMRSDNNVQLDRMRATVDEKLQETLESRLSKSFEQVIKQLESVYKGLGEMQNLAKNVGDLSKIISNVKTRGTWGEVQVAAILEEILSRDQYVLNFAPRKNSQARVEFAIRLPGKKDGEDVYLPVDSKFPKEDYERYLAANAKGDVEEMQLALKALRLRVGAEAKDIAEKYINPPLTTDFAILFVPTESLYAEVLNMDGFVEELQNKYRVVVSGPTTFSALVNSLQMGFKTLAVEKRSAEVWGLFSQMRKQFSMFSRELEAAEKSLNTATNRLTAVSSRSGKISARLAALEGNGGIEEEELPLLEENIE
jgi:Uncharacterized protein conserved in bacteria